MLLVGEDTRRQPKLRAGASDQLERGLSVLSQLGLAAASDCSQTITVNRPRTHQCVQDGLGQQLREDEPLRRQAHRTNRTQQPVRVGGQCGQRSWWWHRGGSGCATTQPSPAAAAAAEAATTAPTATHPTPLVPHLGLGWGLVMVMALVMYGYAW